MLRDIVVVTRSGQGKLEEATMSKDEIATATEPRVMYDRSPTGHEAMARLGTAR